ncbi:hypothetical protein CEP88_06820 [Roseobacter denitrificans]|uniref:PIN domain-containing protein n=2 Tax=Roseobacter denitrificans TaxID=2434 RepID=Q163A2_ROSDO|nr:hypothetical protein [Roseobacter denitrificans]ABG32941.1 hypothetical protein RD1_3451 [Roseobacter denitrificans OCh 114]AVL52332.1 hypothetical protein CEP88_06820 [Roseobacter denitrificans]SFG51373.1 hypothetical protein SAMN05443635_1303 [Roseobacter denitrificans OCh 114]
MTAHDDGYVIHETTAEEVVEHASSLKMTRQHIADICQVVGIEVPTKMDGELLRMSNFLGSQFDCLSVMLRENGVLLSADLRLRQVATKICKEQAFGLDALLRVVAIEGTLSIDAYADVLLKLCGHGHSYVSLNGQMLHRMLIVDETATLERFERAAAYLGTPNADINSNILTSAEFIGRAFRYYGGGLKAQRATSIVLRRLLRLDGIELADMLTELVSAIGDIRVTNYVGQWLKGHVLLETFEHQIDKKRNEVR